MQTGEGVSNMTENKLWFQPDALHTDSFDHCTIENPTCKKAFWSPSYLYHIQGWESLRKWRNFYLQSINIKKAFKRFRKCFLQKTKLFIGFDTRLPLTPRCSFQGPHPQQLLQLQRKFKNVLVCLLINILRNEHWQQTVNFNFYFRSNPVFIFSTFTGSNPTPNLMIWRI